jgi:hypothetical protein
MGVRATYDLDGSFHSTGTYIAEGSFRRMKILSFLPINNRNKRFDE